MTEQRLSDGTYQPPGPVRKSQRCGPVKCAGVENACSTRKLGDCRVRERALARRTDDGGSCKNNHVIRYRIAGHHTVVPLAAHQSRDCGAALQPGPCKYPTVGTRHDHRIVMTEIVVPVHGAKQQTLGLPDWRIAPVDGEALVVDPGQRIPHGAAVADDHAVGMAVEWTESNLRVGGISRENREVDPVRDCSVHAVAHLLAPVLVVAGDKDPFPMQQQTRVLMDVNIGRVADVVAVALEPA